MRLSRSKLFLLILVLVLLLTSAGTVFSSPGDKVRVWVQYAPGRKGAVQAALNSQAAEFHYDFDELESFVVTLPQKALTGLANNPNIVLIEEDAPRYLFSGPVASPEYFKVLADTVDPNGQTVPYGIDSVQALDVWDANHDGVVDAGAPTGAGRVVCIIDTGFYAAHEDFAGVPVVGGVSQVDDNWARDGYGHGTHVAGTIAAANNSLGVVGVTPGTVGLFIVKIFNDNGDWTVASNLVNAIYSCRDNGANVISMSLGGPTYSNRENRAFNALYSNGILSVAAAGNDGTSAYNYPASYNSVVSVAAIDESLQIADFSQFNNQVELAAPGVGVLSTLPYISEATLDVTGDKVYSANPIEYAAYGIATGDLVNGGLCDSTGAWGGKVVLCQRGVISFYDKVMNVQNSGGAAAVIYNNVSGNFLGTLGEGYSSNIPAISLSLEDGQYLVVNQLGKSATVTSNYEWPASGYEAWDGTSMATPHVSAVAALIWSANPSWTNAEIREAMTATALDLGTAGRDNYYGYGLVQAKAALDYLSGGTPPADDPPVVSITSPANGATFESGAVISFSGSATDYLDGNVTADLVWTSNLAGQIGIGGSFSASLGAGTHVITAAVTDSGSNTGSASVTITVNPPASGVLSVSVSTDKPTYTDRQTVQISVFVTSGGAPVEGASVLVTITTPNVKSTTRTGTTDASGSAVVTYKVSTRKDGTGTYNVIAEASKTGYTTGVGNTTFIGQ